MIYHFSDRRNYCCRSAQTTLCKIFYFIKINVSFFHFKTKIMFCYIHNRSSCNRRKNRIWMRCYNFIIFCYENKVCASRFFHFCSRCRIKIHVFIKSVCMSRNNRMKTHCIIKPRLNMPRSVRSCPVKIRYTDRNRFCTTFKIRTYRCCKHSELIFICRLYSDYRINPKHIWSDI